MANRVSGEDVWETDDPRDYCFILSRDGIYLIHILAGLDENELKRLVDVLNTLIERRNDPKMDAVQIFFDSSFRYIAYEALDESLAALAGIDLDVYRGDYIALMGPSGSGKSTLLNLIAGIDKPSSGEIRIAGVDIARLSDAELAAWRAEHVGFIFQFYKLLPVLSAFENVELPLLLTGLGRRERRERVDLALGLVGLTDRAKHRPSELSGGQQQRVAIARALIADPTLIVPSVNPMASRSPHDDHARCSTGRAVATNPSGAGDRRGSHTNRPLSSAPRLIETAVMSCSDRGRLDHL
jgi:ABC-type lipoprotein export system ATPase subunit